MVIQITEIKETSHCILDINDVQELVINTMGTDMWNCIEEYVDTKIRNYKYEIKESKGENDSIYSELADLQNKVDTQVQVLEELIHKYNRAERVNKRKLVSELKILQQKLNY